MSLSGPKKEPWLETLSIIPYYYSELKYACFGNAFIWKRLLTVKSTNCLLLEMMATKTQEVGLEVPLNCFSCPGKGCLSVSFMIRLTCLVSEYRFLSSFSPLVSLTLKKPTKDTVSSSPLILHRNWSSILEQGKKKRINPAIDVGLKVSHISGNRVWGSDLPLAFRPPKRKDIA